MMSGAFGGLDRIADTLGIATPLILCGVAVSIAMVGGVINIGCEGQLYIGALCAAVCGIYFPALPSPLMILLCMAGALAGGGLWAGLAGYLKYKTRANEVVLTIMLNYIAIFLTDYIVSAWLKVPGMVVKTRDIQAGAVLPVLYPYSRFTIGFIAAIAVVLIFHWLLKNTAFGFEIQAMGLNPLAAETAGINVNRQFWITMFISGSLAGLAGGIEVMGVHGYFIKGFSPGYGFDGLSIAVLGQNTPFGSLAAALLYGALRSGAQVMDRNTSIPKDFVVVLQALIIIFVATPGILAVVRKQTSRFSRKNKFRVTGREGAAHE
jgi:simple sugar transport system permease protein